MVSDRKLEALCAQLAALLKSGASGVAVLPALLASTPPSLRSSLSAALTGSSSIATALKGALSSSEHALLEAGEASGRLPEVLDALARMAAERRRATGAMIAGLAYPALLAVSGGFLLTAPLAVTRGVGAWLAVAVWPLVVVIGGGVVALVAWPRLPRSSPLRRAPFALAVRLPVVGAKLASGALASFLEVLGQLLGAGLSLTLALPAALRASGHPRLGAREREALRALERGAGLAEALRATRALPERLLAPIAVAEHAGTLEGTLAALARDERDSYRRSLKALVALAGVVVLLVVVVVIGAVIVAGARDYLEQLPLGIDE